ncbi:DUF2927 domain-containing protein [Oceanibacterium hippocampi]|uniref:Uncharacterized protein n=1 Tax=Oceanibacterium hippocampi TaxID=745714 RepID=A0A1Y5RW35_9PROT|nr:DUF2927 domain-containing protein [Oceanibacterium hippocampi]SLN26629.1 hypothetical protein OCH7691_00836 [Oceanibacterium hippocampi]
MPARWLVVALGLLLLPAFTAGPAPAPLPSGRMALVFFDSLALMRGEGQDASVPGLVRRFEGPVVIRLRGSASARTRAEVARIAARLSDWTGRRFRLVDEIPYRTRHIDITVHDDARVGARHGDEGAVCFTRTWGRQGHLFRAAIDIGADYADCLAHEMMHAVGFDNHWAGRDAGADCPSVLAHRHTDARTSDFSAFDEMAIRLLYSAELSPGMVRAEALAIARRALMPGRSAS